MPAVRQPGRLALLALLAVGALLLLRVGVLAQIAGITVNPTALGALTEAVGADHSATFTVALEAEPIGDVTLTLTHGADVSLDQTTLTFTSANWSSAQTVTVTAVNDSIDEVASEAFNIALSASGGGYDSATAQVSGSVSDDDAATFSARLDKTTLAEADAGVAAGVATLTVTKTSPGVSWPADREIGLTLTGSARVGEDFTLTDGDGWTLSKPFILRFAAGATETTAIISVLNDAHDDDAETVSIAVDADGAAIDTVAVTLTDDDDPPLKLSALAVTTAAARTLYPAFDAGTFHYALGCVSGGSLAVTLSAQQAGTRVAVNGRQVASQDGQVQLTGLDVDSDVIISLSNSAGASTTYTVHCLPEMFLRIVTDKQAGAWEGLITISGWNRGPGNAPAYIAIIDNNGVPRFHRRVATNDNRVIQFRIHKKGKYPYSYAVQHGVTADDRNYEQVVLDHDLTEVARIRTAGLQQTDSHDFVIRENGNYILLAYDPKVRDLTGYFKDNGDPWGSTENVIDSIIQEVTPAGQQVHIVNSWDVLDLDDCKQGRNGPIRDDYAHINSLEAVGGDYITSYRHCSQVLRINAQTGKVVWRLGLSRKSDAYWIARDGRAPLKIVGDPYGEFCGQHSPRMIANGNLILFDNGGRYCNGARKPKQFSRAVEYALDLERGTATFVRHHFLGGVPDTYAESRGIVELMDSGNWLLSWGTKLDTAVTEVVPGPRGSETQGQQLLSVKLSYADTSIQTRAYPLSPGTLDHAWPPGALTEELAESASNSMGHLGTSDTVSVVVAFGRPVVDFAANTPSVSVTGATVKSVAPHIAAGEAAHAYLFELTPTGDGAVEFVLVTGQACAGGGICAKDGSTLSAVRTRRSVPRVMAISGLADTSVEENTAYGPVTPALTPAPSGSPTWSLEGDDAAGFTINSGTGALSMVARDFEAPADADADNVYEVTVRVTDTTGRTAARSIELTVTDADEPPGAPGGLTLSAAIGSLTATWSAGAAPGATPPATTSYDVQYRLSGTPDWTTFSPSPTATSATIDGLTGGSAYEVRVRAVNAEASSAWTAPVSGTPTTAGITVNPTALGALTEAVGADHSATFTVALEAEPSGDVTLALTHGADVSLDQTTLTFTSANWSSAQTVTVTAVNDSIDEVASEPFSIELSASGPGYGDETAQLTGSVSDDDAATFSARLDKNTIAEADAGVAAGVATLTVTKTSPGVSWPADREIGLTLTGSARVGEDFTLTDGDGWTLSKPFILRFAAGATETTAIISVLNDAHDDDAETVSIAVDADGAAIDTVAVTLTDDDDPPLKLSALAVTTAATRTLYPAFDAGTFHYAVGCETADPLTTGKLTVTLSAAAAATRVAVSGKQVANQNGEVALTGLDGFSDVEIVLSKASGASTTYTVHCLPRVFPEFQTTRQSGAWEGLITMKRGISSPAGAVIAIIDNNGVPRFHQKMATSTARGMGHFKKHKNGKYPYSYALQYGVLNTKAGDPDYPTRRNMEQVILREDLTEVERVRTVGLQHTDIHDFVIRANGNYVFISYETQTHDLTGYIKNSGTAWGSTAKIRDPFIQEVTPDRAVVHQVNGWDHLHLDDCKQGSNNHVKEDWAHLNSLQAVGGDYIGGYRFCNQVLRINAQTGKVVWRLGLSSKDDAYWIAKDGKAPLKIVGDPYGEFCGQHSARMIANNHILIFDNGGQFCSGDRKPRRFSRVVEYALDLERGTATFVRHHSLRGELDEYAPYQGIVELMDNGNWLVSWGGVMDTAVTEVIPGPRWSETQGRELLAIKNMYNGSHAQTRSYPVSPGTLEKAWPPGALEEELAESASNSSAHLGTSDTVSVVVAFGRPVVDFAANTPSVSVTGATVKSVAPHIAAGEAAHAYLFELTPTGDGAVEFVLVAGQACAGGGICAKDGATLSTVRTRRSVPREMAISGLADTSVEENTAYGPVTPALTPAPSGSPTWSLEGDDAAGFTINSGTGALSMVARDFEAPADADADNVYEVTVRVTDTTGRTAARSIKVTVTDVNEPPGAPGGLTLSAAIGSLTATWSAGAAPGATPPATTSYDVQYRLSGTPDWTTFSPSPTATSATIDGLTGGSAYEVRVRAVNAESSSAWTAPVSGTPTTAGITVNPTALGALTEAVGADHSATFTVALEAEPIGDVTLTLTHGADVSLDQTTLTFTSANWSSAQTVTVTAVNDSIDEVASEPFSIELSASGPGYGDETAQLTGSVSDDDAATFSARLDKNTLAEADAGVAAGVATLTVTKTSPGVSWPADREIGLTLTGSARVGEDFTLTDGDGWTLSKPFILRFAAGATETTAIISVLNDAHDDDAETVSIAVDAAGAAIDTVAVTLTDDDDAPLKLSALAVTTAATRLLHPAFAAGTFHYAVGCETDDAQTTGKLTLTLSAADAATRVAVNGKQVANQSGEIELSGLDGYSDVKIVLSNASGAGTTYTVHCLPKVFPDFETTKQVGAWDGLITMKRGIDSPSMAYIAIIDNNGVPRFHQKVGTNARSVSHFRTHRNGKYPYSYAVQHAVIKVAPGGEVYPDLRNYEQVILREDLTEVERVRTAGLAQTDNHDFAIRANGNYIFLSYEPVVRDLTGYIKRTGDPWGSSAKVKDSIIQEVTPQGVMVYEVNSWDLFPLDDCKQGGNGYIDVEWAHVNSLEAVGGDYIASYRRCNQVLRINAQTGNVVWRLGLSTKSDAYWIGEDGKAPLKIVGDPYGEFCGQHSARMLANGHLVLFDNGGPKCNGPRRPNRFSRVVEYALDLERGTATFVRHHSLRGELDEYAPYQGIAELMDNGNWLISWGGVMDTAVTEVIPGPRWSETQGQEVLTIKSLYNGANAQTRSYPLSPGTLDHAWPPGALREELAESASNSMGHLGTSDTVSVVVAFGRPVVDFAANTPSVSVTGATVKSVAPHIAAGEAAHAYLFELTPTGDGAVEFVLVAGQACAGGGICAKDGATLSTVRTRRSVPREMAISGLADTSVEENTAYGPVTPPVTPASGSPTWSLEGDDAAGFTINSGTGALSMVARDFEAPADADADNVYEVTVRVTDTTGRTAARSIKVTVTDVNEPPAFDDGAGPTGRSVSESAAAGDAIGDPIEATDPDTKADPQDTLVYAIDATSGDHAHFDIDTSTGQLEVKGALDYEAVKNSYTVTVQVRDSLNAAGTADTAWDASIEVTIAVDDANEKPAFAGNADTTPAVAEGATAVGTYAATDPESDSLTYGLSGTDAAAFGITGAGALSLTSAADHEAQSSYSVNVRVRDSRNADGAADTAWDTTLALDVGVTDADEKPDAPTGVGAAGIANGLRVTWKAPDMARKPALEGYDVEHALRTAAAAGATPATWGAAATGAAGVVEAYEVTGLTPGSTYRVRVRARNDEGDSVWTPYVTGVPTTPPLVNAVPSFDEGAGTTRGVPENTAAGTAIGLPVTATDTDSDTLTYAIDSPNVSPGSHFGIDSATGQLKARGALNYESGTTSYAITVTVSDGKSGTDSIAVTITVDDVDEPPDRPAAPTVSPASTSSLNVRWSAPANKGPAITDYDHRYKKTSENSWTEVTGGSASTALTAVIASLESGASYDVQVRATNLEGTGDWSAATSATTAAATAPGAPTGLGATANGQTQIDLAWTAPASSGGAAISGYKLEVSADAGSTWSGLEDDTESTSTTHEHTGLTAGTTRHYRVSAINSAGTGAASSAASATTAPAGVPGAPTGLGATANGQMQIDLSWTAPAGTGGAPISGYKIEVSDDAGNTWSGLEDDTESTSTTHTHSGLTAGTTRHYRVSAINSGGTGAASSAASATTDAAAGVPGAPTGLTAAANGQTQIDLAWTAPASSGGAAISGYKIEVSANAGSTWTVLVGDSGSTTTTHTHSGLTARTTRHYRVSAINSAGAGAASSAASATTDADAATAPGAPTGLTAAANGQTQIDLSWTAPASSGGAAISGYKLEVSADAGSTWSGLEDDTESTSTTHEHTGLTAGTTRHYRVSAINSAGAGAASSVVSATTDAATAPGAPTGLTATANGQMQIDLSWTAPAGTGGAPISGYKIEVSDDAGNTWSGLEDDTESTSTTHTHSGLTAGTTRHYRVSAINSGGTGAASSAASATTDAAAGVPGAPTGLTAAANGQTQIDLSWTAPASSGGAAISGYKIEVSANAGSTWTVLVGDSGSTTTTHTHSGLTAGTTRHYRVSAINSAGAGAASSVVSATTEATAGPPPAPPVSLPAGGGGGGTGAAGPTPSTLDFEWNRTRDIEALDAGNDLPSGLWSDGETLWVAQNSASVGDAVYAYDLAGGERLPEREFELAETNRAPRGIWSDGETMWVADSGRDRLFAHDLASGERLPERDLELDARNGDARGIWSGGDVLWALDGGRDRLFAYDLASGALLAGYALDPANGDPRGLWSDGVTLWVSDHGAKRLFAYRLPRVEAAAEALARVRGEEFTELTGAGNNSPRGIWSGGEVMYVADANDGKVYSYNMPDAADARLASLTLSGVEFGEFESRRTEYESVAAGGVTETTVEARALQSRATIVIAPPDADGNAANGHQLALEPGAEISVTVTSADGSRTRSYRVRFGSADEEQEPWPDCLRGDIATGFSFVVYEGGGVEQLEICARGLHVTALYVLDDGDYVSSILDAPAFVNQPFRELFPDGLAPVTPLLVASGGPPPATDPDAARLASLTLSGVAIGEFSGSRTQYAGVAGEGVTQTTVVAAAVQGAASILIEPADDAGDALNGHQVALEEGRTAISVTVTAADGSRTRVYRVWIGDAAERREPSPQCLRGEIATGFGLVVYEGGSLEELEACARSLSVVALYVLDGGEFVPLFPGAPAFVNRPFRELFPHGLPPATPLFAAGDGP